MLPTELQSIVLLSSRMLDVTIPNVPTCIPWVMQKIHSRNKKSKPATSLAVEMFLHANKRLCNKHLAQAVVHPHVERLEGADHRVPVKPDLIPSFHLRLTTNQSSHQRVHWYRQPKWRQVALSHLELLSQQ